MVHCQVHYQKKQYSGSHGNESYLKTCIFASIQTQFQLRYSNNYKPSLHSFVPKMKISNSIYECTSSNIEFYRFSVLFVKFGISGKFQLKMLCEKEKTYRACLEYKTNWIYSRLNRFVDNSH